jgi:hypothetical protein
VIEANRIQFRYSVIAIASNVVLEFLDQAGNVTKYGSIVSKLSLWQKISLEEMPMNARTCSSTSQSGPAYNPEKHAHKRLIGLYLPSIFVPKVLRSCLRGWVFLSPIAFGLHDVEN